MKTVFMHLDDEDFNTFKELKGNLSWKEFLMNAYGMAEQKEIEQEDKTKEQQEIREKKIIELMDKKRFNRKLAEKLVDNYG